MVAAPAALVLGAALLLAGGAFDSPSLYVPGVAFVLLVVGLRLWVELAARRVDLEREPGPWAIVEGDPYPLAVAVRAGGLPLPGGRIVHPLATRPAPLPVRPGARAELELRRLRRGRREVGPVMLLISDPLRLHTAELRDGAASQVLVLPRVDPVDVDEGPGGAGIEGILDGAAGLGAAGLDTRPIDFEIDGLRPYRHGSPASRIHWPTVARSREMVEHRLVGGVDASPLVVLDSSQPADLETLDRAVRAAASLCVHLAPLSGCALLLSGERAPREIDPQLRTWPQAHARLALVRGGGPPPATPRASGAEVVFWVTAAAEPPAAVRGLGARACYLVGAFPQSATRTAFSVAGCHARRLGAPRRARPGATEASRA